MVEKVGVGGKWKSKSQIATPKEKEREEKRKHKRVCKLKVAYLVAVGDRCRDERRWNPALAHNNRGTDTKRRLGDTREGAVDSRPVAEIELQHCGLREGR